MKSFFDLIKTRKSIRSFEDKSVSKEVITGIIEAATYAPTNCNQQLWNFVVVDDSDVKERLIKQAASNTLFRRAPAVIVVTYDGWNRKEALQGGSLAVGHMLLAAHEMGVGALPMNSYGADSKVKRVLQVPDNQIICCVVALGYPDERAVEVPLVPRREVGQIIHWNTFLKKRQPPFTYNPEEWTKEDLISHQRFYSRKTFLGKEMDIMSDFERDLVRQEIQAARGSVLDLLSYDGAYLREFPKEVSITTVDLCKETAAYSKQAAKLTKRSVRTVVLGAEDKLEPYDLTTILFKLERVPSEVRAELYKRAQGELLIIARKRNIFLSFFFLVIKILFGRDIRKTGIYAFFGPYKPIALTTILKELNVVGFRDVTWRGYFFFPAFFEQVYQMFLQYRASEGSSYLHREKRSNLISTFIASIVRLQRGRSFGKLGSVVVIRCRR